MIFKKFSLICAILIILIVFFFVTIDCKIGRGGGGTSYRSGGGNRFGSRVGNMGNKPGSPAFSRTGNSFSGSRTGIRWSSFGAGMVAYGVMSSLINRGHYHPTYYHRHDSSNYRSETGSTCVNNEDFNGTTFGSFTCPLPGFNPSAKYCCGSLEYQTQYCCEFFDDDNRKIGVIVALICIFGIIFCGLACIIKIFKRQKKLQKYNERTNFSIPPPPMNMRQINRNFAPPGAMRPPSAFGPQMGPPRPMPQTPVFTNPQEGVPFLNQQDQAGNKLPYPTQSSMPMPMPMTMTMTMPQQPPNPSAPKIEQLPPSYVDAVKKKEDS